MINECSYDQTNDTAFNDMESMNNEQLPDQEDYLLEHHNYITDLPDEIISLLFTFLDAKSMVKSAMTNHYWYQLLQSKDIQFHFKNE